MVNKQKPEKGYTPLTKDGYLKMFRGYSRSRGVNKLANAHKLAWETRNFEIDKFWIRTAFFGGFTALIFNGYIDILSGSHQISIKNLDIYLICLGIIFSTAWLLSVFGSKHWQENWEAHIDMLEDEITGPLYKIIYCRRWWQCFSVSKINLFLVFIIGGMWIILLIMSIIKVENSNKFNRGIIIGIVLMVLAIILMVSLCRSSGSWKIQKKYFKIPKGGI
jgi:hypothetical protein